MTRVLPIVVPLARALRDRTVYTRFIPPANAREVRGSWRRYYERCPSMSREQLDPKMLELVQPLAEIASLGAVVDKRTYSPWLEQTLELRLAEWGTETRDCFLAGSSLIRSLATPGARFTFDAVVLQGSWHMVARLTAILALSFGFLSLALAQNVQSGAKSTGSAKESETGPSGQTGAGERGTKVGPTTTPDQPPQPTTAKTGVEPRGTKVAPSTNPTQGGQEKQ